MDIAEIEQIKNDPHCPITINHAYKYEDKYVINGYIALKVKFISNSFQRTNLIALIKDSNQIGDLLFTNHDVSTEFNLMNDFEFICFLTFGNLSDFYSSNEYKFESDFVLIKEGFLIEYLEDYIHTSPIWGGFVHENMAFPLPPRYKKNITSINLGAELKNLDSYSYESGVRALEQPYAFERFLKLYHLLELQFDYFIIEKIQKFEIPRDSNQIGKTLNEYSRNELERLTDIILHYCSDIASIEQNLTLVMPYRNVAEEIFIKFGKGETKPLTDLNKFNIVFNAGAISHSILTSNNITNNNTHPNFICKLTAYWIYRIRCSIAHNKIGEYLLSWNDENFIVEFAEPLLKEVLAQCFKK